MANDDVKRAVQNELGNAQDNLHRARAAFRGLPGDDMGRQYGESGKTRAEIVSEYEAHVARWEAALASLG